MCFKHNNVLSTGGKREASGCSKEANLKLFSYGKSHENHLEKYAELQCPGLAISQGPHTWGV